MKVEVQYAGHLREARGVLREGVEVEEGATAEELVRELAGRHEGLRGILQREDGEASRALLVLVGDELAAEPGSVVLREGEVVTLLPAIGGG